MDKFSMYIKTTVLAVFGAVLAFGVAQMLVAMLGSFLPEDMDGANDAAQLTVYLLGKWIISFILVSFVAAGLGIGLRRGLTGQWTGSPSVVVGAVLAGLIAGTFQAFLFELLFTSAVAGMCFWGLFALCIAASTGRSLYGSSRMPVFSKATWAASWPVVVACAGGWYVGCRIIVKPRSSHDGGWDLFMIGDWQNTVLAIVSASAGFTIGYLLIHAAMTRKRPGDVSNELLPVTGNG
jgi:hypothetical protein